MTEILEKVVAHPSTAYLIGFGGLATLLSLALAGAKKFFDFHDKTLGITVMVSGALGGMCLQASELVILPGGSLAVKLAVAAFVGVASAFAAAGFSAVDLREVVIKKKETE